MEFMYQRARGTRWSMYHHYFFSRWRMTGIRFTRWHDPAMERADRSSSARQDITVLQFLQWCARLMAGSLRRARSTAGSESGTR